MRSSSLLSFGRGTLFYYSVVESYYFVGDKQEVFSKLHKGEAQMPRVQDRSIDPSRGLVRVSDLARLCPVIL